MLKNIDKIYCINLNKRKDRWEETQKELKKFNLLDRVCRYPAVDGKLIENKTHMLLGEYGLILTHIKLLTEAVTNGYENIIIFEDDIEFINDFQNIDEYIEKTPEDYDILYLGGNHIKEPTKINDRISRVNRTFTTHAMLINKKVFTKLIEELNKFTKQLDVIYTDMDIKLYTCIPSIVTQRDCFSDIQNKKVTYKHWIK